MRYVLARIANDRFASEIANAVDILQAITWTAAAWKEVTEDTIKNCFVKCGIVEQTVEGNDELDEEFDYLFKELTGEIVNDMTADEYVDFDVETCISPLTINSDQVDWRRTSIQACIDEHVGGVESGDDDGDEADEVTNDDDDDNDDQEESSSEISPREALGMLDQLVHVAGISKDDRNSLVSIKERMESLVISHKKQTARHQRFL